MSSVTYPVLAVFTGSAQGPSRPLSSFDRISVESSLAIPRCQSFSCWKPRLHPPTCPFSRRARHRKLQKTIQHPETQSGSVQ
jgi:hypothetical protein